MKFLLNLLCIILLLVAYLIKPYNNDFLGKYKYKILYTFLIFNTKNNIIETVGKLT